MKDTNNKIDEYHNKCINQIFDDFCISEKFKNTISTLLLEEHQLKNEFESQEEIQAEESLYKGGFRT